MLSLMASDRSEELFTEGWREPSDDCERTAYYLVMAVVLIAGLTAFGWGSRTLLTGLHAPERMGGLISAGLGAGITGLIVFFFAKESKHWDLRHLTAERVVAGGFLLGFALLLLAFQIASRSGSIGSHIHSNSPKDIEGGFLVAAWLGGAGVADLTFFLIVGLLFAYAPALQMRRRLSGVRIERRYAIDDKLGEIEGHPCPRADGLTPVVMLRFRDGRTQTVVCAEPVYEWLKTGTKGTAVVRGKRLERFHPA